MIHQDTIAEIQSIPLEDIIGAYVELKKSGSTYKAPSPFSDESTPSFYVTPAKGIWKCFSSGHGGNNAISFVMKFLDVGYVDAIKDIAQKNGITITYDKELEADREKRKSLDALYKINRNVQRIWTTELADLHQDHPANRWVFGEKGYDLDTVVQFGIGYAPDKWKFLGPKFINSDKFQEATQLGLVRTKEGNTYDVFIHRVIFPIYASRATSL